jgi:hypothetical protein
MSRELLTAARGSPVHQPADHQLHTHPRAGSRLRPTPRDGRAPDAVGPQRRPVLLPRLPPGAAAIHTMRQDYPTG